MPFGKHRGEPIGDLPRGYLCWLDTLPNLRPDLKQHITDVLCVREPKRPDLMRAEADAHHRQLRLNGYPDAD